MSGIRTQLRELARGRSPFTASVEVAAISQPAPGFSRVSLVGDLGEYLDPRPADAFKLFLPASGSGRLDPPARDERGLPFWPPGTEQPLLRAFTVSEVDVGAGRLSFDVALHADGLAIRWLRSGPVGQNVAVSGMRGDFAVGTDVEHHVFAGDGSAVPAIGAALRSAGPATVLLVGVGPEALDLLPRRNDVDIHLSASLAQIPERRPPGHLQVWVAGEAALVRSMRARAVQDWDVDRDDLHASAYWKQQEDNTAFDAANLQGYRDALARGGDVTDPDLRESVELDR